MARIECYLSDGTKEKLAELAKENGDSISKYIGRIVENHLESKAEQLTFQTKIQAILANILSSVYDKDIIKTNTEEVKSLLKMIDDKAREKSNLVEI